MRTVLKAIDQEAERQGMTRSGFLVRAAKREIQPDRLALSTKSKRRDGSGTRT